jgi:hypothetical protein
MDGNRSHKGNFLFSLIIYYVYIHVSFAKNTSHMHSYIYAHSSRYVGYLSNHPDTLISVEVDDCSEVVIVLYTVMHNQVGYTHTFNSNHAGKDEKITTVIKYWKKEMDYTTLYKLPTK